MPQGARDSPLCAPPSPRPDNITPRNTAAGICVASKWVRRAGSVARRSPPARRLFPQQITTRTLRTARGSDLPIAPSRAPTLITSRSRPLPPSVRSRRSQRLRPRVVAEWSTSDARRAHRGPARPPARSPRPAVAGGGRGVWPQVVRARRLGAMSGGDRLPRGSVGADFHDEGYLWMTCAFRTLRLLYRTPRTDHPADSCPARLAISLDSSHRPTGRGVAASDGYVSRETPR